MDSLRAKNFQHWAVVVLAFIWPRYDRSSDAFVLLAPVPKPATCVQHGQYEGGAVGAPPTATCFRALKTQLRKGSVELEQRAAGIHGRRYRGQTRTSAGPALMSFQSGTEAAGSGGAGDQGIDAEGGMDTAPVDLDQSMGSFAPEWKNGTTKIDPKENLIKGSIIAANQTDFPYPIDSFPPLTNREVYYNGTSERFWWNQNSDAVCVYVPVPKGFDPATVEFVPKTKSVSLKLGGEEILSGTTFYRIDGYDSLYVVDLENDPPYVQLELFKVRDFQNWEDLIIEGSTFSPGGAQ